MLRLLLFMWSRREGGSEGARGGEEREEGGRGEGGREGGGERIGRREEVYMCTLFRLFYCTADSEGTEDVEGRLCSE